MYWGVIGIRYTCDKSFVKDTATETALTKVIGAHLDSQTDAKVEAIMVTQEKTLNRLPPKIGSFFPNLQALVWTHGNITSLHPEDIEQVNKLVILVLGYNKIVTLSEDLFKNMPQLLLIEFNNNLLEHVEKNTLMKGKNLDSADFRGNPCIDVHASQTYQFRALRVDLPEKCFGIGSGTTTTTEKPPTNESNEL